MKSTKGRVYRGQLVRLSVRSVLLGIDKGCVAYLPAGYGLSRRRYPVLYLFRGHENEWINPFQDSTRHGRTAATILDDSVARGIVRPLVLVMPGLSSDDQSVFSPGIDMIEPPRDTPGIGSGAFERFVVEELIPFIDGQFRTLADPAHRGADGFSLGGYAATMLAVRHPDIFSSVGSYDGLFMWYDLHDPRIPGGKHNDRIWLRNSLFDPVFGRKRSIRYMKSYNPLNLIARMNQRDRERLRHLRFHLHCAAFDGMEGNRDRTLHFVACLRKYGIENSFRDPVLNPRARHNWRCADLHLRRTLPFHDSVLHS